MGISWLLLLFSTAHFYIEVDSKDSKETAKLRSVQVLFRHGARAPSEQITDPNYHSSFPRGLGEMTDRGFENSYKLGRYLKKRYVDKGFLDPIMKPKEMFWRSVNKNRCLSTASTVGFAMFDDQIRHIHVPVVTEEIDEKLLNYNLDNCPREVELVRERCPNFDGNYHPWPRYEAFIANCLNYTHPVFAEYPFETIEAYMNEYKNSIPPPPLIEKHINEIMAIYVNVTQFITGTGNHHDPRMMKVKFGFLMETLLENIREMKESRESKEKTDVKKFTVYSTQDWILMGVLDSLGVLNKTVGLEVYPEYNSMIIIELWEEKSGKFYVKTYYKKEEITAENHELIDVSNLVRNCEESEPNCSYEKFVRCCDDYKSDEGEGCEVQKRKRNIRGLSIDKAERKKPLFAGPE
ncbi:hypothetical protein CRE_01591 [Caenorhabditis remanei]|uniref:Uncharacterized protein n=1 Tax=Caenorhabditis remanei TaxID=31234 RepID=E3LGN2_CAERE|nr:hypothetical protein CRE_01591 [Caenorhabditis remanei]